MHNLNNIEKTDCIKMDRDLGTSETLSKNVRLKLSEFREEKKKKVFLVILSLHDLQLQIIKPSLEEFVCMNSVCAVWDYDPTEVFHLILSGISEES